MLGFLNLNISTYTIILTLQSLKDQSICWPFVPGLAPFFRNTDTIQTDRFSYQPLQDCQCNSQSEDYEFTVSGDIMRSYRYRLNKSPVNVGSHNSSTSVQQGYLFCEVSRQVRRYRIISLDISEGNFQGRAQQHVFKELSWYQWWCAAMPCVESMSFSIVLQMQITRFY